MAGLNRKISAASARAHTRKSKQGSSFRLPSGMLKKISLVLFMGFIAWAYQAIQPPPPKICGSSNGPPITAPRIKLRDGRYLAYKEDGVPRDKAKYKFIFIHGTDSCRHDALKLSPELTEELGVYLLSFDRPGYGESDPNPKRTEKSTALDIEELADQLELGSKFYVIGYSMGGQVAWTCLKYIPPPMLDFHGLDDIYMTQWTLYENQRLAGVVMLTPVVNYWWPGLPANISNEAYKRQPVRDQWALRVAHYAPWLAYWWNSQKWFPTHSVAARSPNILSSEDKKLFSNFEERKQLKAQVRQQGDFETIHRDMIIGFGSWEFSPTDLDNPFPNNEGSVHLWQGDQDLLVPVAPQRYIAEKLPWIHYHEVPGAGHFFGYAAGFGDAVVKALLLEA